MPKWPVSFVDGSVQVADADGTHYPIFMHGAAVTGFNPGWSAVGLQTGLAPFHVLELRNQTGELAYWMLDTALDYRGNAVVHLNEQDRQLYLGHVEPLVRNLFEEAVLAPLAAIPAAAHEFDGFLGWVVADLIRIPTANAIGAPDVVSVEQLSAIGGTYTRPGVTLPADWIEPLLRTPIVPGAAGITVPAPAGAMIASQETLALPEHAGYRFHDRASGLVFYLLAGTDALDRHLYVPSANAVFTAGDVAAGLAHDPLGLLLSYYATHTDRVVMLPEADGLRPMQAPMAAPAAAAPSVPDLEPWAMPAAPEAEPWPPVVAEPAAWAPPRDGLGPVPAITPMLAPELARPPRQNWWQRLLGLGNG